MVFDTYSFENILRYGIAIVIVLSVVLALAYSLWGWLLLITSGGKEEKVKPAVNHIRHALIGLVVLMIVLFTAPILSRILGFDYPSFLSPSSIFSTIKELSSSFFGGGSSVWTIDSPSQGVIGNDFTDL